MNHLELANCVLGALREPPAQVPPIANEETRRNNAARCMSHLFCNRLSSSGQVPERVKHTTFEWRGGLIALRNARIVEHHWSTLQVKVAQELHQEAQSKPVVYVLTYWAISDGKLHAWAIPEDVAHKAFSELPTGGDGTYKTVELFPDSHTLKKAPNAPDLSPYYVRSDLLDEETNKLVEAIKIDHAAKRANQDQEEESIDGEANSTDDENAPFFTSATTEFMKELPDHVQDADWHEKQKSRYQRVLRNPVRSLVEALRNRYIERLSPEVAGGKRHLSILKKNDYGKGGYHDHYWFAFYDPNAGSKTKSVQLFMRMIGSEEVWRYGFAMGNYCDEYLERLQAVIQSNPEAIAEYIRQAPSETSVRLWSGDDESQMEPGDFADLVASVSPEWSGDNGKLTNIGLVREFPLDSLPDHDDGLVDEIGAYFTWAWPFFEASMTGTWPGAIVAKTKDADEAEAEEDVDEDASKTIAELSAATALSQTLLSELEESLLAKQQTILVGPPGTSKTYIARHFARYFVRQRTGRPQGSHHVLYMHANWTYEDFFEGIKPATSKDGMLTFQPQKGFFLEWVEQLKAFDTSARHVLVLDEINRCDTAAVLGELLQLLEYRGTTVRLLSGRRFVFPRNLYIIGTMNSADRSIGRMDLALRRRFLWLNLHSQPDSLQRWLDRLGNNPVGFKGSALAECNDLLAKRGIPPEQHIGHALFMVQESDTDDEMSLPEDIPLTEKHLRRTVQFSVLPYVRELFTTQFGQVDEELLGQIRNTLLSCLNAAPETDNEPQA
jgi:uncharacterized protein (DUF2461 family)